MASGLKSDRWILEQCRLYKMIYPFNGTLVREVDFYVGPALTDSYRIISRGLTSYGYDISVSPDNFRVYSPVRSLSGEIDPKHFEADTLIEVPLKSKPNGEQWWSVPPHTYALAVSVEYFRMPRSVLGICLGKSTYARAGLIVNATPLEPEWCGNLVLELSNSADLPMRVYATEGIAQVIFIESSDECLTSYADRAGKYQAQTGLRTAEV